MISLIWCDWTTATPISSLLWRASVKTQIFIMSYTLLHFPEYAREQRICIQPSPSRASRKKRLKKGKGFFAWPRGKEPDCNSLWYYTRSLNSQQPPPPHILASYYIGFITNDRVAKRFGISHLMYSAYNRNCHLASPYITRHLILWHHIPKLTIED